MKLTIADREAFVRAAMDDVPKENYDVPAHKLVLDHLRATVPVDLQNTIAKYPDFFDAHRVSMPAYIGDFNTRLIPAYREVRHIVTGEIYTEIIALSRKAEAQTTKRTDLVQKLRGAINGCTTLKQALEILPEFAKYLPQERDGKAIRSMPVIANLVADLMQAGWPKDKANAQAAAG